MTDLFDRLFPADPGVENVPVHYFRAALGDYATGNTTKAEIIAFWSFDADAQTDLSALCDAIDAKTPLGKAAFLLELHDVMMIAESGTKYITKAAFKTRLGL
jgi:hypothetical protein